MFEINDGQKPLDCALSLNGKMISEGDKHYSIDYKTERKMFRVSIPHFQSELNGVYECVASTVEEPTVSTSVEVVVNCKLIGLQGCHTWHTPVFLLHRSIC